MLAKIEVRDREEAQHIRRALKDKPTRAFVVVMGALLDLESDAARSRVLRYVEDLFEVKVIHQ